MSVFDINSNTKYAELIQTSKIVRRWRDSTTESLPAVKVSWVCDIFRVKSQLYCVIIIVKYKSLCRIPHFVIEQCILTFKVFPMRCYRRW